MKATSLTTSLFFTLALSSFAGNYTVKSGDTLHSISRKHQLSVSQIMTLNNISDPTKLRIGQALNVSHPSSRKTSAESIPSSNTTTYRVSKGDTLYSIARRHKLSVDNLKSLNPGVSAHRLSLGQSLAVSGTASKTVKKSRSSSSSLHKGQNNSTKISTAPTLATKTTDPAPEKETAAVVANQNTPISTPPSPPVVEDHLIAPPTIEEPVPPTFASSVASVILTDQITFDTFASKHGTDTAQLNALNGWNLPKATVLARGSEIYVPQ